MIKFLRQITFYNYIIKLKSHLVSHIAVASFYLWEIIVLILTIYETILEQINISNGYIPDYVFGFKTYLLLNQFLGIIILGIYDIALLILFLVIIKFFKKNFMIKTKYLINSSTYNLAWTFGIYTTLLILLYTFVDIIRILLQGIIWLIEICK